MSCYAVTYSESLSHHGILGQKWGKRNGPPYPLGAEDHSARERKAGWRASLKKSVSEKSSGIKNTGERFKKKLVDKAVRSQTFGSVKSKWDSLDEDKKRKIKTGLAIAGTVLVAYGAYRLYRGHNAIRFVKPTVEAFRKESVDEAMDKLGVFKHIPGIKQSIETTFKDLNDNYKDYSVLKIKDPSEIKHWDEIPSIDKLSKSINPNFTDVLPNKPFDELSLQKKIELLEDIPSEYTTNCMYCTTAYDLNRRGYKVQANGRLQGGTLEQIAKMYKLKDDAMSFDPKYGNVNKYLKKFSEMENGARGNMLVSWKAGGGHSMAWEVVDNQLNIIDCQSGQRFSSAAEIKKLISKTNGRIQTVRTDNADIIWDDMMLRSLEKVGF